MTLLQGYSKLRHYSALLIPRTCAVVHDAAGDMLDHSSWLAGASARRHRTRLDIVIWLIIFQALLSTRLDLITLDVLDSTNLGFASIGCIAALQVLISRCRAQQVRTWLWHWPNVQGHGLRRCLGAVIAATEDCSRHQGGFQIGRAHV